MATKSPMELLRELEWSASRTLNACGVGHWITDSMEFDACPSCRCLKPVKGYKIEGKPHMGHSGQCELAAALEGE